MVPLTLLQSSPDAGLYADPFKVIAQAQTKLALNAAPLQIPMGLEEQHSGLIDLLTMKAHRFDGPHGESITSVRGSYPGWEHVPQGPSPPWFDDAEAV